MVALIIVILLTAIGATIYFIAQFFENNPTQPEPTGYITGIIVDMNDNGDILVVNICKWRKQRICPFKKQ